MEGEPIMITKPYQSVLSRLVVLSLVALLGIFSGLALTSPSSQAHVPQGASYILTPAPKTLEALVDASDIIVIGTVGPVTKEDWFLGYDTTGKLLQPQEPGRPTRDQVAFFDHTIKIERILKGHQTKDLKVGQTVPLRMFAKSVNPALESQLDYPPSIPGERRLFFLNTNPDHQTYGLTFNVASRLIIDGEVVTKSDGKKTPVNYGSGAMKPNKFINEVKAIVKNKKQKGEN